VDACTTKFERITLSPIFHGLMKRLIRLGRMSQCDGVAEVMVHIYPNLANCAWIPGRTNIRHIVQVLGVEQSRSQLLQL